MGVTKCPGWDTKNGDSFLANGARGVLECYLATGWGLTNGAGLVICHQLFDPTSLTSPLPNGSFVALNGKRVNTSPCIIFVKFDADRGPDPQWLAWIRAKHRILLGEEFNFWFRFH